MDMTGMGRIERAAEQADPHAGKGDRPEPRRRGFPGLGRHLDGLRRRKSADHALRFAAV